MEKITISDLYLKSVYKLEDFYRTSYYKSMQPRLEKLLYRFREDLDSIYLGIVDKLELDGDLFKSLVQDYKTQDDNLETKHLSTVISKVLADYISHLTPFLCKNVGGVFYNINNTSEFWVGIIKKTIIDSPGLLDRYCTYKNHYIFRAIFQDKCGYVDSTLLSCGVLGCDRFPVITEYLTDMGSYEQNFYKIFKYGELMKEEYTGIFRSLYEIFQAVIFPSNQYLLEDYLEKCEENKREYQRKKKVSGLKELAKRTKLGLLTRSINDRRDWFGLQYINSRLKETKDKYLELLEDYLSRYIIDLPFLLPGEEACLSDYGFSYYGDTRERILKRLERMVMESIKRGNEKLGGNGFHYSSAEAFLTSATNYSLLDKIFSLKPGVDIHSEFPEAEYFIESVSILFIDLYNINKEEYIRLESTDSCPHIYHIKDENFVALESFKYSYPQQYNLLMRYE